MKNSIKFLFCLFLAINLSSCSDSKDGDWDDNIHLSKDSATFSAQTDSITVTTGGDWWWVDAVSVGDENFYNFQDVDLESDNYTVECDDVVVSRRDKNTLFIKAGENPSENKRLIVVGLEAGDYFDRVVIWQEGK